MDFLLRKCALVEPQVAKAIGALGDYCSFKRATDALAPLAASRRESLVLGLRLEWREGKSKVHVTHKVRT